MTVKGYHRLAWKWGVRADGQFGNPGAEAYANARKAMWERFEKRAEQVFTELLAGSS